VGAAVIGSREEREQLALHPWLEEQVRSAGR
jgi:hypothetical protein